jgi:hypothetical protein
MNQRLMELMREFLAEIESLIEEDDGLVFQIQHIEQLEELLDLLEEEGYG